MSITTNDLILMQARLAKNSKRKAVVAADNSFVTSYEEVAEALSKPAIGSLTITGQIRGGKNHVNITCKGKRYPDKVWAAWRDRAVAEVRQQLPKGWQAITEPVYVNLEYVAGDNRRRDMPAIVDAIWHVLEKAGVVEDDTLLWISESSRSYDKAKPRATIEFIKWSGLTIKLIEESLTTAKKLL